MTEEEENWVTRAREVQEGVGVREAGRFDTPSPLPSGGGGRG